MKNSIELYINVPYKSFNSSAIRIAYGLLRPAINEEILLSYMIKYSRDGIYRCGPGSTKLIYKRLKLTKSQYALCIGNLLKNKAISKPEIAVKTTFISYQIKPALLNILKKFAY